MLNRRAIDGILLLDKPNGITSNAALQKAKYLFRAKKAGHTGSLDPMASGLLPICFGEATKFSRFLLEADKQYQVTLKLGVRTDSGDAEGNVLYEKSVPHYSLSFIESVLERFRGDILQMPSMYSALKHQGKPLYKLARLGIEIERARRPVSIYRLDLKPIQNRESHDVLNLSVHASKGTYVRTLVDDIGEALGCGAHVIALRRTGVGHYGADQMVTFTTLEIVEGASEDSPECLDEYLLPLNAEVFNMPDLTVSPAAAYYICRGQAVAVPYAPSSGWVWLTSSDKQFIGVGEILADGRVAPRRLTQKVVSF